MTFVSNGLLVHAWGVLDELTWNYPSWSISAEWAAYLSLSGNIDRVLSNASGAGSAFGDSGLVWS